MSGGGPDRLTIGSIVKMCPAFIIPTALFLACDHRNGSF